MQTSLDELSLYDLARQRLRGALSGRLSSAANLEDTLTAYAYWVCTRVRKQGADWEATLREYIGYALRDAANDSQAEQREMALLRHVLSAAPQRGRVLDVGAGWGRMSPLYDELGLPAVYVEPAELGTYLMRRSGLDRIVRSVGESLPFADGTFATALVGWILHHDAPDLDAARIVREAARVVAPGGQMLSIEPLNADFDIKKWTRLLNGAGFNVSGIYEFFEMPDGHGAVERYTLAVAVRLTSTAPNERPQGEP
jgi:SAM-dependent methyltransferase